MKLSTSSVLFTLLSLTTAQSAVSTPPPTTTAYSLTPQQSCLASCPAGDVNCQAACVGSAHPNSAQVSETNQCAASCVQGNGSTAETNLYAECLAACISSYYPTSQTAAPVNGVSSAASNAGTTATGAATKASSGAGTAATGSGASSQTGSATGTAGSASVSKAAAATGAPFIGMAGLFMAALAL
jgi:hypothetical protein